MAARSASKAEARLFLGMLAVLAVFGETGRRMEHKAHVEPPPFIEIATASRSGSYYPFGLQVCHRYNVGRERDGGADLPRCAVVETEGSQRNIRLLRAGLASFAIVQKDVLERELAKDAVMAAAATDGAQAPTSDTAAFHRLKPIYDVEDPCAEPPEDPQHLTVITEGLFMVAWDREGDGKPNFHEHSKKAAKTVDLMEMISFGAEESGTRATIDLWLDEHLSDSEFQRQQEKVWGETPDTMHRRICKGGIVAGLQVLDVTRKGHGHAETEEGEHCSFTRIPLNEGSLNQIFQGTLDMEKLESILEDQSDGEGHTVDAVLVTTERMCRTAEQAGTTTAPRDLVRALVESVRLVKGEEASEGGKQPDS